MQRCIRLFGFVLYSSLALSGCFRSGTETHYTKYAYDIPMRDGTTLYTAVYVPKDTTQNYPFLMKRSPYSSGPYEKGKYPGHLGPNGTNRFAEEGYIFVYQDVRGRFMSEGTYRHMTPACTETDPPDCVDESTDMHDTVAWLLNNVGHNNGRVGIWGISYPGFYAAASIINSHPAIKAASPQAPIADWFVGDDFHHNGAFYLQDAFAFLYFFESPGPNPTDAWGKLWGPRFDFKTDDAYQFFLDMGALPNANDRYFHHKVAFWDSMMTHGTYDAFWQSRNLIPHMKGVTANVMTVGGLYDAEDPHGPVGLYRSIETNNPGINNILVLGPWFHGGWVRADGDHLGDVSFEKKTSVYYQENVDLPFFNYYLKDKGTWDPSEVLAFASGSNEWHHLDAWPPSEAEDVSLYLTDDGAVTFAGPSATDEAFDAYVSDPANPVPYTQEKRIDRTREYMVEDQRFAGKRPDVLVYQTSPLTEDMTFAGPISADLFVSSTGTDADFVVKLIDVYPDDTPEWQTPKDKYLDVPMGGYEMMVRGQVFRAKFRHSFEHPEPLTPGEVTEIAFDTPDIFHTFKAGHRIMVQVQSSWFPLVDRNPQTFTDIYSASDADFQSATQRIYRSAAHPSHLRVKRMRE